MSAVNIEFPGNLAQVDTAQELRRVPSGFVTGPLLCLVVELSGVFKFDSSSVSIDDGTTVIRPLDRTPLQAGRWLLSAEGLAPGAAGPTGPANSSYPNLVALKAADASKLSYILATSNGPATYTYTAGDFTGRVDDVNVIALNSVPITTGALVGGLAATAQRPVTNRFTQNIDGAKIDRLGDRVFIGGANKYDGNFPNDNPANQDWYTAYERLQGRGNGIIVSSQFAVLTNNHFGAAIAGLFAARTSNLIEGVGGAIGLEAHGVNDNVTTNHDVWGGYTETTRDAEGVGAIIGWEFDTRNKGDYHPITPYAQSAKQSVGVQIAAGGALTGVGVADSSAAINIRHNPTSYGVGICFGNSSIRGTDGNTGYGDAIMAARGHRFVWVNSAGQRVGSITGSASSPGALSSIEFAEIGLLMLGSTDNVIARFRPLANSVNYLDVTPGIAGASVQIGVAGSTNVDLFLKAAGTGIIAMSVDAVRNYANDAGAAAGGVGVGGLYHSSGALKIRIA